MKINFTIPGQPQAQKRHRSTHKNGNFWNYDPSKKDKLNFVKIANFYAPKLLINGAISLSVEYYFARPKSHYGTGRNSGKLKESAPMVHIKMPDIDNCLKFTMDALQLSKRFFDNDSQINEIYGKRFYSDNPRTEVLIIHDKQRS